MPTTAVLTSSTPIRSSLLRVVTSDTPTGSLIEALLREQGEMTAVDRFSKLHEEGKTPSQSKYYRELVPTSRPGPGQQYAFEVNLDVCTGCKACVASCHSLNGLDDAEVWRTVGALHGGTPEAPSQQTVTTSCHHCVEPACMLGCPVQAYEKDAVTGIVKHLDDQCIGCQYCTLMCPYDAPKYNKKLGIVRKCDMCTDRLSVGEAPACVQGCPNEAISIRIIEQAQAVESSQAGTFLPGAPTPEHTVPTTIYKSERPAARNMLPADFYSVSPEHLHMPLVALLVLTQLATGAFTGGWLLKRVLGLPGQGAWALAQALVALGLAGIALAVSVLHLGRPAGMWRVFLGLKTSWMSREAIVFGGFAGAAAAYVGVLALPFAGQLPGFPGKPLVLALAASPLLPAVGAVIETATVGMGLLGVLCSVMIYVATRRAHWRGGVTGIKFFGSVVVLGAATINAVSWALGHFLAANHRPFDVIPVGRGLLWLVLVACVGKLTIEVTTLLHLRERQHTVMKRVAILMVRDLHTMTVLRFIAGGIGGVLIPVLWLGQVSTPGVVSSGEAMAGIGMFGLLLVGEFLERALFFAAAPASRMPGALS